MRRNRRFRLAPAATVGIAIATAGLAVMLSLTEASAFSRTHAAASAGAGASVTAPTVVAAAPALIVNRVPADQPTPAPAPTPNLTPTATPRAAPSAAQLGADLQGLASQSGAQVSVTLIELGPGAGPVTWSLNGGGQFTAASTYKLPLLMAEAQGIAAGSLKAADVVCYQALDWEDGWYEDYVDGSCYQRQVLATRVGQYSDNTAAHILVRELGGADALNAYARAHGAHASSFYEPNTTTSADLAALWADEAAGRAGGPAAQSWLYPLLTQTNYECGIPDGSAPNAVVVHKVGFINGVVNDAALVRSGATASYILVVCTDGPGGESGYALISSIAARVATYEASR